MHAIHSPSCSRYPACMVRLCKCVCRGHCGVLRRRAAPLVDHDTSRGAGVYRSAIHCGPNGISGASLGTAVAWPVGALGRRSTILQIPLSELFLLHVASLKQGHQMAGTGLFGALTSGCSVSLISRSYHRSEHGQSLLLRSRLLRLSSPPCRDLCTCT